MKINEFNEKKIFSEASGVAAYVDKNLKMTLNNYGYFVEEIINTNFDISPLVEFVIPNFNQRINEDHLSRELFSNLNGVKFNKNIGYFLNLYAGHVNEGDYRASGSSGGMTTWILKELFERKYIDGVIHVKKVINRTEPILFEYGVSKTLEEIIQNSKSKYYPVELSKCLNFVKENPGKYALVGIPSFITAIRLLSKIDDEIKNSIKFTIGLITEHQKSSKMTELFGWQVGIMPGKLKDIDYRYKLPQSKGANYSVKMIGQINGYEKTVIKNITELFGDNWRDGYFKVPASDFTDDVFNETADVTLGDAWIPPYNNDNGGNNIVISRNEIIQSIIYAGINSKKIVLDEISIEEVLNSQKGHLRHTKLELPYRLYKKDKNHLWRPNKRTQPSNNLNYYRRKIQDVREKITYLSHEIYLKAKIKNDIKLLKTQLMKLTRRSEFYYKLLSIQEKGIFTFIFISFRSFLSKVYRTFLKQKKN
jgi:coenzyme F420 hydrogenase subunit beta